MVEIHADWKRGFDVYDRIKQLGIDLGTRDEVVPARNGRRISLITFTPSGLIFFSGAAGGSGTLTDDEAQVQVGREAGRQVAVRHIRALHWGLDPFGTLNDVWYCVKCIGMVNSPGGGQFTQSPLVVDGYSKVFHDIFGGPFSQWARDGLDASLSGWHARSAVAGFDLPRHCRIEVEMIVQIDPELALRIIRERGPHL